MGEATEIGLNKRALDTPALVIDLDAPNATLRIADPIEFEIGYSETSIPLHERINGARAGRIETVWPVLGRGKLQ